MFDWDYGIALPAMQMNRASFSSEGDVSYDFSSWGKHLGSIRELQREWPFETPLSSAKSGILCSYQGHLRNQNLAWQDNTDTSGGEVGDQVSLSSFPEILGFLSIFKKSQVSSAFEALNSTILSRCQGM